VGIFGKYRLQSSETHLVGLACKEHGAIADAERALLLLALLVDLGHGPGLDIVGLDLG
jgi:hypothetical protein